MDTETCIHQVLQEHLLTNNHIQLTKEEAKHRTENLKLTFKNLFNAYKKALSKSETTYFQCSLQLHCRLPIFYGLPKVHKTPVPLRPVVSSCGSFMSILSTWLDFHLKSLLPLVRSYTKNSFSIITDLKHLQIPEHALLFSADAKSMYTNMDINIGINSIRLFLTENSNAIPTDFPKDLILEVLTLVMENNIFSFCNTYWLQLTGTAMGTPVACSYATVAYGQHENKNILTTFSPYLLYYQRYIDGIFGIWLPSVTENNDAWNSLKEH
jgi:DNA-directed RNA polymerase subunit H (RpoH/RPB5)